MLCGLDFGTSNCSIGHLINGKPKLIPLELGSTMLPSVTFSIKREFSVETVDENEVLKLTNKLYQGQKASTGLKQTKEEIEKAVRKSLKKDLYDKAKNDYDNMGLSSLSENTEIIFGAEAIKQNALNSQDGIFTKSPKTFLGSEIESSILDNFSFIVEKMISHIKQTAEENTKLEFTNVVLGRPVDFGVLKSKNGNKQAVDILEQAAKKAGFKIQYPRPQDVELQ